MNIDIFKNNLYAITGETAQNKIADLVNATPSKVSRWFAGESVPTLPDLLYISQKYHCSIDWLIGNEFEGKSDKPLSPQDICRMLVKIDASYSFKSRTEETYRDYFEPLDFFKRLPREGQTVCTSFPILYFDDRTMDIVNDCFVYDWSGEAINDFLQKYFELREIKEKGLISKDIFVDVVNSHISKLSNKPIYYSGNEPFDPNSIDNSTKKVPNCTDTDETR